MITLTLKWMGRLKEIEFPCTDTELQAKLADLRPPDASPAEIFVSSVEEPTALCMLETQFVNLDEINFLAKRMESFDYDELLQFYAAAQYEGFLYPKDLINLTFNLPRYTVIHDLRNMETVGKAHYMNIHGCITHEQQKKTDFASIGRELIRSGNGTATEFGLLFKNDDIPIVEAYDGVTFPEYYYGHTLVSATIDFEGRTEYLYLPCDDLAITKAIAVRLIHGTAFAVAVTVIFQSVIHSLDDDTAVCGRERDQVALANVCFDHHLNGYGKKNSRGGIFSRIFHGLHTPLLVITLSWRILQPDHPTG